MFALSDKVFARREQWLSSLTTSALEKFRQNQLELLDSFAPCVPNDWVTFLQGGWAKEEQRFVENEFRQRGFEASIKSHFERKWTSYGYVNEEYVRLTIHRVADLTVADNAVLSPLQWRSRCEEYAFSWLTAQLSNRLTADEPRALFEFQIQLPPHSEGDQYALNKFRHSLFERPLKWINKVTCYNVRLENHAHTLTVSFKDPQELAQAEITRKSLLFASLHCVRRRPTSSSADDRDQVALSKDWALLPEPAMERILHFLVKTSHKSQARVERPQA